MLDFCVEIVYNKYVLKGYKIKKERYNTMTIKMTAKEIAIIKNAVNHFRTAKTESINRVVERFSEIEEKDQMVEIHGREMNCLYVLIGKVDNSDEAENLLDLFDNLLMGWNGK